KTDVPASLEVHGGTDVQWAPTVDYFRKVFLPALGCFGARVSLEVLQRGYYPKGQGSVLLRVEPAKLKAAHFSHSHTEDLKEEAILGLSHCSNLPEHVARRQAEAATKALQELGFEADIALEVLRLPSLGSGITLWSGHKGASSLGERGLAAEKVGKKAAEGLIPELKSAASVDMHLADQLIPYLALAGGSYTTREISLHARTNIWTAEHFLERKISVSISNVGIIKLEA
ncbi:MAG: RNA 3'-terminal phosphate cyclase, partial [Methanothrix sp.]|nr:RNA 3'-terminal phosphate cyclase [Methanothrix sp.]